MPTPLLYLETNFLMGHATGRDAQTEEVLARSPARFRIVMPSVCFMEAFSAFEDERKRHYRLVGELETQRGQSRRNVISPADKRRIDHLDQAIDVLREVFDDFQVRLYGAIERLRNAAELINPTPDLVGESLARALIEDPADNLILASILNHANAHSDVDKAFLSEKWKDFEEKPFAKSAIERVGVKDFRSSSKFLEWQRARPES